MIINDLIINGSEILKKNNIESYKLDSEILLTSITKRDRVYSIINDHLKVKNKDYLKYLKLVLRRKNKEPIAYIIKKKEFWSKNFYVDKNVLIPRPDTEVIIEDIKNRFNIKSSLNVLDIGTGSGCILFSILKEFKKFRGIGIDKSKKAIEIARYNSKILNIDKRLKLIHCDVDNYKFGKYDVIVSNPPYICSHKIKYLSKDIKNFEPIEALDGGLTGLKVIKKVITRAKKLLKIGGYFYIEIGIDQSRRVELILIKNNFKVINRIKDYSKNIRCIISTRIK